MTCDSAKHTYFLCLANSGSFISAYLSKSNPSGNKYSGDDFTVIKVMCSSVMSLISKLKLKYVQLMLISAYFLT